jgi:mRNA deadenylase 3'-5' endonuclease subunit Ccr4
MRYTVPDNSSTIKYRPNCGWRNHKIDYLLVSKEFSILEGFSLYDQIKDSKTGCPNELCPSDHMFLKAKLSL